MPIKSYTINKKIEVKIMIYGYAGVSSYEQNEERQIIALKKAGVTDKKMYIDKMSGKNFNRPQYKKLIRKLKKR